MSTRPEILFVTQLLPWPLVGGGQIKSYHLLRLLAERYTITLLAFVRSADEVQHTEALRPLCLGGIETVLLSRSRTKDLAAAARALLTGSSFLILRDSVPAMHEKVEQLLSLRKFAALHIDHLQMMQFVPRSTPHTRVVLDEHNVEYRIPKRLAETPGGGVRGALKRIFGSIEWRRLRAFERAALLRADRTLAVSEEDRNELSALNSSLLGTIETIPIGVDLEYFAPAQRERGTKTLVSMGTMFWPPNVDAMEYFCSAILPRVRECEPEVKLNIVGARPTPEIVALGSDPAITVTGAVPDVRDWARDCGVFIVPLRSGSGMRVKILNALAMGLPTVSTTVGAEGIDVIDGEHLLLADTPEAFAEAVVRLLRDPDLAERLSSNGRRLMEERYGWAAIGERLHACYAETLAPR